MRIALGLLIAAAVLTPRIAHAQQEPTPVPDHKSPNLAFGLSFGGSMVSLVALPAAVFGTGESIGYAGLAVSVVAPSAGTLYAGKPLTTGLAMRAAGALTMGVIAATNEHCALNDDGEPCTMSTWERRASLAGLGAIVVGTVFDWVSAPTTALDHNRRYDLALTPVIAPQTAGLSLTGSF